MKRTPCFALVALLSACGGTDAVGVTGAATALSLHNVSYGSDPAQVMDLELPAGRSSATSVVIFIHGGGWSGGDKSIFGATDLKYFTTRGFACVNMNYRLASAAIHDPLLSDDVTSVINQIVSKANDYQISATRIALIGHSAGAHLALLAAYKYNASKRIKAVVSLSGPTDLNDPVFLAIPTLRATVETFIGATQSAAPARWSAASPLSVAAATSPPTVIVHGKVDGLVPYLTQATALHARLVALGVPDEYDLFPLYDHDLGYAAIGHFPTAIWDSAIAWFGKYVTGS